MFLYVHVVLELADSHRAFVDLCLLNRSAFIVTIRCDCQCHVLEELCILWPIITGCVGALAAFFGVLGADAVCKLLGWSPLAMALIFSGVAVRFAMLSLDTISAIISLLIQKHI